MKFLCFNIVLSAAEVKLVVSCGELPIVVTVDKFDLNGFCIKGLVVELLLLLLLLNRKLLDVPCIRKLDEGIVVPKVVIG